ncbi:MAG: hypothetical protein FGM32_03390 [Candidatus Kapabacteria bacterium]|nr:hypothetical protein [Candidatus Kapabacteria bacterium]
MNLQLPPRGTTMINTMRIFISLATLFAMMSTTAFADINRDVKNRKDKDVDDIQRTPTGVFDQQKNSKSKVDFITTNYGIFGFDVVNGQGGTFWPRGKGNQYLFAGGAWFAARKRPTGSDTLRQRVVITYNPNSGKSWMVPGALEDGLLLDQSDAAKSKNRIYFSTDFSDETGIEKINPELPNWPIWDNDPTKILRQNNYFGNYINNVNERRKVTPRDLPAFVSGEDIFSIYKDTDLSRYEGGASRRKNEGYPLGLQIEQIVYTWGFGDYGDLVFMKYLFIHPCSYPDTLFDCWMGAVQDVDIAPRTNPAGGAQNDRARYFSEAPELNLAVQWTNGDRGEAGQGFGYLGFNFLESPAIDADKFLRKDKLKYDVSEQLGMRTMRNWPITEDPLESEDRYQFMSAQRRDGDLGPGDRRLMMATGPFHMKPCDSARIVVGIVLATTTKGGDADGTLEDMAELVRKVRFAQSVYDNNFIAPKAPREANFRFNRGDGNTLLDIGNDGWMPLNNGVAIQWDSTSELSVDTLEQGLDFMGYRLYRARRKDLDTFDTDFRSNARKGPLGWKQIAQYAVPSPFVKFGENVPTVEGVKIDQFKVIDVVKPGSRRALVLRTLSFAEPWGSYFAQLQRQRDSRHRYLISADGTIQTRGSTNGIPNFYKIDSIQFCYMRSKLDTIPVVTRGANQQLDAIQAARATDTLVRFILKRQVVLEPFLFPDIDESTQQTRFRPFEELNEVRRGLIAKHINRITRRRTFVDLGDDDRNGDVSYSSNPEKSEKLINNVDYYYAIRAYDEGDYSSATESKLNDRSSSNMITTSPRAARPGLNASFTLVTDEENLKKIGGVYNIRLLVPDEQKFNQMFAGKTLDLTFNRIWAGWPLQRDQNDIIGLYGLQMTLSDSATGDVISQWSSFLPPVECPNSDTLEGFPYGVFTEQARSYVNSKTGIEVVIGESGDTIRIDDLTGFVGDFSKTRIKRGGSFVSNARCLPNKYALGTVGIGMDYTIQQFGGIYRADTAYSLSDQSTGQPRVSVGNSTAGLFNQTSELNLPPSDVELPFPGFVPRVPWPNSYNNGPGTYEVTFKAGGRETITTKFALNTTDDVGKDSTMTFPDVEYLEYEIRNVHSFKRPELKPDGSVDSIAVSYDFNLAPQEISFSSVPVAEQRNFPNIELIKPGHYGAASYGWRNSRNGEWSPARLRFYSAETNGARPLGKQLRYYKSRNLSSTMKDTLDFVNIVTIGGAQFVLDASLRGRRSSSIVAALNAPTTSNPPTSYPSKDFEPGDKVVFVTSGGAFGFPFDGTKARIKVLPYDKYDSKTDRESFTDDDLEQVQVVPNPYYVSHEGMRSPFEGKIFFTRLPRVCTISIYTVNGELVSTLEHNELDVKTVSTLNSRQDDYERSQLGAEVWDLLTRSQTSKRRVNSQMFVAKIETPAGASVIRKFSVVVGPARFPGEGE